MEEYRIPKGFYIIQLESYSKDGSVLSIEILIGKDNDSQFFDINKKIQDYDELSGYSYFMFNNKESVLNALDYLNHPKIIECSMAPSAIYRYKISIVRFDPLEPIDLGNLIYSNYFECIYYKRRNRTFVRRYSFGYWMHRVLGWIK